MTKTGIVTAWLDDEYISSILKEMIELMNKGYRLRAIGLGERLDRIWKYRRGEE